MPKKEALDKLIDTIKSLPGGDFKELMEAIISGYIGYGMTELDCARAIKLIERMNAEERTRIEAISRQAFHKR